MVSDENYCDANEFYHPTAFDNCQCNEKCNEVIFPSDMIYPKTLKSWQKYALTRARKILKSDCPWGRAHQKFDCPKPFLTCPP